MTKGKKTELSRATVERHGEAFHPVGTCLVKPEPGAPRAACTSAIPDSNHSEPNHFSLTLPIFRFAPSLRVFRFDVPHSYF